MRRFQTNGLPIQILKAISLGVVLSVVIFAPNSARWLVKGLDKKWNKRSAKHAMKRLREHGFIEFKERKDKTLVVKLTKNGKEQLKFFQFGEIELHKPEKWDGIWRIILFDIPEKQKMAREALRGKFNEWGLYRLQQSVFVCPYPCSDEVDIIRELFRIRRDSIIVLETRSLPYDKFLKQRFKIHAG